MMSRNKHLEKLEENLLQMSVPELRTELAYWREHANRFTRSLVKKLAMKRVHEIERVLLRKEVSEAREQWED